MHVFMISVTVPGLYHVDEALPASAMSVLSSSSDCKQSSCDNSLSEAADQLATAVCASPRFLFGCALQRLDIGAESWLRRH